MELFKATGNRGQNRMGYGGIKIGDCTTVFDPKEEEGYFSHQEILDIIKGKAPYSNIVIDRPYDDIKEAFKNKEGATLVADEKKIFINTDMGNTSMDREEAWEILLKREVIEIDHIVSMVKFSGVLNGVATLHHGDVKSVVIYGGGSMGSYSLGDRLNQFITIKGNYIKEDTITTKSGRGEHALKLINGNIIEECISVW